MKKNLINLFFVFLSVFSLNAQTCTKNTLLRVDAGRTTSGVGDGLSWSTAFKNLDEAIKLSWKCTAIKVILVAEGTYKPTLKPFNNDGSNMTTSDPRDVTFHLRPGVEIYAGYSKGGSILDPKKYRTVLDGKLPNGSKAYHVVLAVKNDNTSLNLINGCLIQNGEADFSSTSNFITVNGINIYKFNGGGIYSYGGRDITISNNIIINNTSSITGGGIYLEKNKYAKILNNDIFSNKSKVTGGGISLNSFEQVGSGNTDILIDGNKILSNVAFNGGAGIYLNAIPRCAIVENFIQYNEATLDGGGILSMRSVIAAIKNVITGNTARSGGAMYVLEPETTLQGQATFIYSNFICLNTATVGTGAIELSVNSYPGARPPVGRINEDTSIISNVIAKNTGGVAGGINITNSSPASDSSPTNLYNNTFFDNSATFTLKSAGAVYVGTKNGGGIDNQFINNIFYNNSINGKIGTFGADITSATNNAFYNNILQFAKSSYVMSVDNGNLFATIPQLKNINDLAGSDLIYRTADDGLSLLSSSPAKNAGSSGFSIRSFKDVTYNENTNADKKRDIGAYEYFDSSSSDLMTADTEEVKEVTQTPTLIDKAISLSFVPNPAPQGNGALVINSTIEGDAFLKVIDKQGHLIDSQNLTLVKGTMTLPYNLNLTENTMLFYQLTSKEGTVVQKVIVGQ